MEMSGEGREAIYIVESSVLWLSSEGGTGIHLLPAEAFTAITQPFLQQGTRRGRLTASYLCGTAADLNPVGSDSGTEKRTKPSADPTAF